MDQPQREESPPLDTPILLLVFNRPEKTRRVLEAIAGQRPNRLYIACDGPRPGNTRDVEKVAAVKQLLEQFDWPCHVKRLYQKDNLGCGLGVSTAINWFFDQEPCGIILEDDCLPNNSFFRFCQDNLDYHRNNLQVWSINGYLPSQFSSPDESYRFSRMANVWGWASWADRWAHYTFKPTLSDQQFADIAAWLPKPGHVQFWRKSYQRIADGTLDTWDYQWVLTILLHRGLTISPGVPLVDNIGFDEEATHTGHSTSHLIRGHRSGEIRFPLQHPAVIEVNDALDCRIHEEFMSPPIATKISRKIMSLLHRFTPF